MGKIRRSDSRKKYQIIETTADIGIAAEGRDLPEVFGRAAAGMMSLITDSDRVEPREARTVRAQARDLEGLLAAWLSELLYLFETEDFVVKDCVVITVTNHPPLTPPAPLGGEGDRVRGGDDLGLEAQVRGERVDRARHVLKTAIKAVTYHGLQLKQVKGSWQARVIFDV